MNTASIPHPGPYGVLLVYYSIYFTRMARVQQMTMCNAQSLICRM